MIATQRETTKPGWLFLDIGNTHTHAGLGSLGGLRQVAEFPTSQWRKPGLPPFLRSWIRGGDLAGIALCSVVPPATARAAAGLRSLTQSPPFVLTHKTALGIRIRYPRPASIGPDRLANAIAARHYFGAPAVVVDFGTAVTFDVIDAEGCYVGGVIAPGLAAMTDYLHEKTALLPHITIREVRASIGRSTRQAMLIGAVHGYRGLVREILSELRRELRAPRMPVIATGGCAKLIAAQLPEIVSVRPALTLDGLRLAASFQVELKRESPLKCLGKTKPRS